MPNLIFKKYFSKIIPLILVLLFFGLILVYTQKRGVFAQEEEMTICVEMVDLDLPGYIRVLDEDYPLLENEMEIPIGQSTDEIEEIAGDILEQLSDLINAAQMEAEAAEEMADLIADCGQDPYDCTPNCKLEEYNCHDCNATCKSDACAGEEWHGCGICGECDPATDPDCNPTGCPSSRPNCCCKTCCDYRCIPNLCTGSACPPGIDTKLATIQDSANKISAAYGKIDDYFIHRFLPATWIRKVQYGDWAKVGTIISVPWTSYNPNTGAWSSYNLDTEQGSKDLCGWLHDNQYNAWEKLCITPISFVTTGSENIPGKLDKSRPRLRECGLAIAEQELLLGPTAEIGCKDILVATIPISSYLDVGGDPTDLCYHVDNNPTRFCKSCHGQFYCEAENKGYCAEDYFCCH